MSCICDIFTVSPDFQHTLQEFLMLSQAIPPDRQVCVLMRVTLWLHH